MLLGPSYVVFMPQVSDCLCKSVTALIFVKCGSNLVKVKYIYLQRALQHEMTKELFNNILYHLQRASSKS
jgi:hypothetical protein